MKIIKIKNAKQMIQYQRDDIKHSYSATTNYWTTRPILIKRNNKEYISNKWLINNNHELVYWLPEEKEFKNNYINLKMFEIGKSYCSEIYLLFLDEE